MARRAASFSTSDDSRRAQRREEAIYRGLAKRLEDLAEDRDRRERAAAKADEEFALGFLMAARQVFDTMDKDGEGIIDRSVCDNAMSATKAKFDAKASGTVTLADGRVVPASSVPPGTKLAGGATMPEAAKDGTCLLYTSPSPRDKRQSRMPSSA